MQPPDDPPAGSGRWVSTAEAMRLLDMSEGALRRAIRDNAVLAELRRRNPDSRTDQRMVYEVWIPDAATDAPAADAPRSAAPASGAATDAPAATTAALEILSTALESEREERQRVTAELRAETAARAAAEARADAEARRADDLARRLEAAEERLARPWWKWW